jgi:hypothetical protein
MTNTDQWLEFSEFKIREAKIQPLEVEVDAATHLRGMLLKSCGFELECEAIHPDHQLYMWSVTYGNEIIAQTMGSGARGAKKAIERMFREFNAPKAIAFKKGYDEGKATITNLPAII